MSSTNNKKSSTTTTLPPSITVVPGATSSSHLMTQQQGASFSTLPNVLRTVPCLTNTTNTTNTTKQQQQNKKKQQQAEKNSSVNSWGVAAVPSSQHQHQHKEMQQKDSTNNNNSSVVVPPGRVCNEEVGSLVDVSSISLTSTVAASVGGVDASFSSTSTSSPPNDATSNNNNNKIQQQQQLLLHHLDQNRMLAMKSASQSELMMGLKVHPDFVASASASQQQQNLLGGGDITTTAMNEDAAVFEVENKKNKEEVALVQKMNEMNKAVRQTIAKRKEVLAKTASATAATIQQQQQQQQMLENNNNNNNSSNTRTASSSSSITTTKQQQQQQQKPTSNNTNNNNNQQKKKDTNSDNNNTTASSAVTLASAASVAAVDVTLQQVLDSFSTTTASTSSSTTTITQHTRFIQQINDLLLRRIDTKSFSLRSSVTLDSLSQIVKLSFVTTSADDDEDQKNDNNNNQNSKKLLLLQNQACQLSLFCTIFDRLPQMFKCHSEISEKEQKEQQQEQQETSSSSSSFRSLSQLLERILAHAFTQEAFQIILGAFSSVCRFICKSTTADENTTLLLQQQSTTTNKRSNNKNNSNTNNNNQQQKEHLQLLSKMQRSFMSSCFTFGKLLHDFNRTAQFLNDSDISSLLDCCIHATTAHAHRDVVILPDQGAWKEYVFAPAARLLHVIQIVGNYGSIAKMYLRALPKTSSSNTTMSMFSVAGVSSSSSSTTTMIHLSSLTSLALMTSMPIGMPSSSSSETITTTPQEIILKCHLVAREWASELVDVLLRVAAAGSGNSSTATTKDEKSAIFAISERFCDDLIQVMLSGVGATMFPLWDCLVKEFSASLVRTILKNDEIVYSTSDQQQQEKTTLHPDAAAASSTTTTTTTKTATVAAADKLRAHVVGILGKLAVAVGNVTSLSVSSTDSLSSSAKNNNSNSNNNIAAEDDDDDLPFVRASQNTTTTTTSSIQRRRQQQRSQQDVAVQLLEKSSKWLSGDQFTIPWKKMAQAEYEEEVEENLIKLDFGGSEQERTQNNTNNNKSKKNTKNITKGRKNNNKRNTSSSSSDDDEEKNHPDAAATSKISKLKKGIPKLSEFAFSDSMDHSTRLQYVRYHLLSELAKENNSNDSHNLLYMSARQYFLARWAYRVAVSSSSSSSSNKTEKIVPFKSLFAYDPSSTSSSSLLVENNNNNTDAAAAASSSSSSSVASAMTFIRKHLSLLLAEDVTFNKTQHPDSVLFPRNADMFMKLILNVFQRNSSSSTSSSSSNNNNNNSTIVVGWDSARKSALKIISKLLHQNPSLIQTAWSLVRRSLGSTAPGVRAAVIPLLVNLLQLDEPEEEDELDVVNNQEENNNNNNNNNTTMIMNNSKNPVGFDDLLLESESFINNNNSSSNLVAPASSSSTKQNKMKTTSSMFTALVLACQDSSPQVQTPAVNALCDILESTSSFGTLSAISSGSSRKIFNLFQEDQTIERFALSRLLQAVLPSPSSSSSSSSAATLSSGSNKESTTATGKLFTRVCKMFSTRWLSPLMSGSSSSVSEDGASFASSSSSLFAETHMNGVREEWIHLASFGLEPPFDDNWISTANNFSSDDSTSSSNNNNNNNSSGDHNNLSFRSISVDDTKDLHLIHPLTLITKNLLALNSNNSSSLTTIILIIQRTIRFCLRPWLLDKTEDEEEENLIVFGRNNNNKNTGNNDVGGEQQEEDNNVPGKIFAAIRRIGDASPNRLIVQSCPIFVSILSESSSSSNTTTSSNDDDQQATQLIHSCDALRSVIASSSNNNGSSEDSSASTSSSTIGVFDIDRVVTCLLSILSKYSGSYATKVIAACCRCLSAILTVSDRVGSTRHIEKVFRFLNGLCLNALTYSIGLQNQSTKNESGWSGAAPIIKTKILPAQRRFVYLISALVRCHQNWASKDYPSLKTLDLTPTVKQNILTMAMDSSSSSSSSSSSASTGTLLPSAIFKILTTVNNSIDVTLNVISNPSSKASSCLDTEPVISQLFNLRAQIIRAFGSLCMLDASTYIRMCERILKSSITAVLENGSSHQKNNINTNNNNNSNSNQMIDSFISQFSVGVAVQAVQAITDFLVDEELRIKSANADEKLHLVVTTTSNTQQQQETETTTTTTKKGVTCNDSAVTFEDVMGGQKDQNSGLGPWILQQFWPLIQPLIGCPASSASLQVAALSFCRIASSQGLASPITFLPALIFGACHTSSFSPQDRSSSLECLKVIFEHHEDTVAGQFAPAVVRCFDFIHQRNSLTMNNNNNATFSHQEGKIRFFRDLAAFDCRAVYAMIQLRGKKRREAFLNVLGKMMTSTVHQETWLRNRLRSKQKERNKNTNQEQQQHQNEEHQEHEQEETFDSDLVYETGMSLCYMMMFCARNLFSLPLQDITEMQLLLSIFETGFQQNMEISLSWSASFVQQQQKGKQQKEDALSFCRNLSRCVAALLCVECHYTLMNVFGLSKAKLEKWEAKQHQKGQTEVSFAEHSNNNSNLMMASADAAPTSSSATTNKSSTTKAEKAIARLHNAKNFHGRLLDEVFDEFLMGTAIRCIDPIFEGKLRDCVDQQEEEKEKEKDDTHSKMLGLHQILTEKNDFMATTVLSSTSTLDMTTTKKSTAAKKQTSTTNKKQTSTATATSKKKINNKKKNRSSTSSSSEDEDVPSTDEDEEDDDDDSSSVSSSSSDDEDDSDSDDQEEEEEQIVAPKRGTGRIAQARRRARSVTPPPPPAPRGKKAAAKKK